MTLSITEHFSILDDPRIERKKLHLLTDILVLAICAMLSGAEGYEAIEEFGRNKEAWLRRLIPLKHGIPSHDWVRYVITRLPPKQFQACFLAWAKAMKKALGGEVIAVDGKTSRRSHDRKRDRDPLHMVSAWGAANRLVLGQEATSEKSNEITAIPALLSFLELKGCFVTIDAMGCQRSIAAQIFDQSGDYVLGLKGNQGLLHEVVEDYFTVAQAAQFEDIEHGYRQEVDKGLGRLDVRRYWIVEDISTLPRTEHWKNLRSIGMVERTCTDGSVTTVDKRYFINSIAANAQLFAHAVRGHWGVENRLHWRLDVVFSKDNSRIRIGNAPAIMSTIRHMCLNLLESEDSKLSMKKKRLKAAWNNDFRYKLLFRM